MTTTTRCPLLLLALLLGGCATPPPATAPRTDDTALTAVPAADDVFIAPAALQPQVDFWRNVYVTWSRGQVALHDTRYMNLIYVVLDLPGSFDAESGYTDAQRAFVREYTDSLKTSLQSLERKRGLHAELTAEERALFDHIVATAGAGALTGAAERLRSQRGLRERFKRGLEISGRYDRLFRQIFRDAGLPEDLAYLPHVESSFQAHAQSSAGAVGLWQFTKGAAKTYMRDHPALDERLDPVASARGAARYLRHAHDVLGPWPLALTSYNHGIGGMKRARNAHGDDFARIVSYYDGPAFGFASRNFYAQFLAARDIARSPARFFPEGLRFDAPLDWERVVLEAPVRVSELAAYYDVDQQRLGLLNVAWTAAARQDRVALPTGVEVWLPPGTLARVARSRSASPDLAFEDRSAAPARVE